MSIPLTSILDRKGRDVVTVSADATLAEAAQLLHDHNIGAAVVRDGDNEVAGILSERDIVRHLATDGEAALAHPVSQAMTFPVTSCDPHVTTDQLMATMTESRIRHLPVVEDGHLVGIVSIGDVVKAYIDDLELQRSSLERYVTGTSY